MPDLGRKEVINILKYNMRRRSGRLSFLIFHFMPKIRKRKAPITNVLPTSSTSSSKPESSRAVIRRFHVLLKRQAQLQKLVVHDLSQRTELAHVEREIEELGGLETYQRMSAIGQGSDRGGGSEKVLIRWLKDKQMHKTENKLK